MRARGLGFRNVEEAVRALRMDGATVQRVARRLGIHENTVRRHTPVELRGEHVITERARQAAQRNLERARQVWQESKNPRHM